MKAHTNTDYYNILLECCKEAFEIIESKEFLYSNEAMTDSKKTIVSSKESIEQIGVEANNSLIVNYQIELNVRVEFLKYLERQQIEFERDFLIERNDFYKRCLTSINIELTKLKKKGNRILTGLTGMGTRPDPLLYLEYMKREIKHKSLQTNETPKPQQTESVNPDEVLKNEFDKIFKNDIGFTIFTKMFEIYKDNKNKLANFSFLFFVMEKDFLVCSQTDFVKFLENDKYDVNISKIDNRQWYLDMNQNNKTKLYNSIKERYHSNTIKAQ